MITLNFRELIDLYNNELKSLTSKQINKLNNEINNLNNLEYKKIETYTDIYKYLFKNNFYLEYFNYLNKLKINYEVINQENIEEYIKKYKKYKIIKKIGSGSFGVVYLVKFNNKKFALKVIKNNYVPIKFVDEIINEFENGKITGKNKITPKYYNMEFLFNEMTNEMVSFIEMEYIQGKTLNDYLQTKKLNQKQVEILENKIKKLHKLNIVHRDLHKNNIMVVSGKKFDIYLIDLGFSKTSKKIFKNEKKENYFFIKNILNGKKEDNNKNKLFIVCYSLYKNKKLNLLM